MAGHPVKQNILNCKCGSFAVEAFTIPGHKHQVHCFNEQYEENGSDCEQEGPMCETSEEAIARWNAGERILT